MKPYLIGIAGFSCSGKTTIANALAKVLPATIFGIDDYYIDHPHLTYEERCGLNFDHPETLDGALIAEHLRSLAAGKSITRPVYDFARHARAAHTREMAPNDFIIVEGLFTLHWPEVRELFGTKVFLEAGHSICLDRRERRDVIERGRSPESVQNQYAATVRPMAEEFIVPTRKHADLVLSGAEPAEASVAMILEHVRQHRNC